MAHNKDYVPAKDADFDGWLDNLIQFVLAKTTGANPPWPHIPQAKVTELTDAFTVWHNAYLKCLGPHTSVDTEEKNDTRTRAERMVRPFVQQFLKFDPVSNEDRKAMNLPIKDDTRTAIPKPTTRPVIGEIKSIGGFRVEIPFFDESTPSSKARPYGCNGCLLSYSVGSEKGTDYNSLVKTKLLTHAPFTFQCDPAEEGKYFTCACRWQNETGELGPWSEIHHVVVS